MHKYKKKGDKYEYKTGNNAKLPTRELFLYHKIGGDTLFLLAQRFNTTVEAIIRINPGINPNNLRIGQIICIPGTVTPPEPSCPNGFFFIL